MADLPPITRPKGTFTPGTLLDVPVKRITPKSAYLKKLDKQKRNSELAHFVCRYDNVSELKSRKK